MIMNIKRRSSLVKWLAGAIVIAVVLLSCSIESTFPSQFGVAAGKSVIQVPQDYPTIQDAVAHARTGDRIEVDATGGPYQGPILIDKSLTLKSTNGRAVIEAQTKDEVIITVEANSVGIEGFELRGKQIGIYRWGQGMVLNNVSGDIIKNNLFKIVQGIQLLNSTDNLVIHNVFQNAGTTVELIGSDKNTLQGNMINSVWLGISLSESDNNVIEANSIRIQSSSPGKHTLGIHLDTSTGNILKHNTIENARFGIHLYSSNENNLRNNTTLGVPESLIPPGFHIVAMGGICMVARSSYHGPAPAPEITTIPCGIFLELSNNNTIEANVAKDDWTHGIAIQSSRDNIVLDNIVENDNNGITLSKSIQNVLSNNTLRSNSSGFVLIDGSNENTLEKNTIQNNSRGIYLESVDKNLLKANVVENNDEGVFLSISDKNKLENNLILSNSLGISLSLSDGNTLSNNAVKNSAENGIELESSYHNELYGNIVQNNSIGISVESSLDDTLAGNTIESSAQVGLMISGSEDVKVQEGKIGMNDIGIELSGSFSVRIENADIYGNRVGVVLEKSNDITLENNRINSSLLGVELVSSNGDVVRGNTVTGNQGSEIGLSLRNSESNTLENNTVDTYRTAISLMSSAENHLHGNTTRNSGETGIALQSSNRNTLDANKCDNNAEAGISLDCSNKNFLRANSIRHSDFGIIIDNADENIIQANTIQNNVIGIDMRSGGGNLFKANIIENNDYGVLLDKSNINIFCFPPFYAAIGDYGIRCFPYQDNDNKVRNNNEQDFKILDIGVGELLVQFEEGVSYLEAEDIIEGLGTKLIDYFRHLNIYHLEVPPGVQTEPSEAERFARTVEKLKEFDQSDRVSFAELNVNIGLIANQSKPNDPYFDSQWNLSSIGIPKAWGLGLTDSSDVLIGVIDTGVAVDHPDLEGNLLTELGHDFVHDDESPMDRHGHGTFISGIIGAVGDNDQGIAGISWKASIVPLQVGDVFVIGGIRDDSRSDMASILAAIDYAIGLKEEHNLRVINLSLGYSSKEPPKSLQAAINKAEDADILIITAAGNAGKDNDTEEAIYPCNFKNDNIICVGASTDKDKLADFSNFGATSVDLVAPGKDIVSLVPAREAVIAGATEIPLLAKHPEARLDDYTGISSGTSFAVPHVTGMAALLFAACPGKSALEIKNLILSSVEKIGSLEGKVKTGGMLKWPDELPPGCRAPTGS